MRFFSLKTEKRSTERLLVFSTSVLVLHVMSSLVQEAVFYLPGFHHTGLLTFAQATCISLLAGIQLYRTPPTSSDSLWSRLVTARRVPLSTYLKISLLNTASVYLTNEASRLLSYSTQVVFKSSKLLFVWMVRYILIELPLRHEIHRVETTSDACAKYSTTASVPVGIPQKKIFTGDNDAGEPEGRIKLNTHEILISKPSVPPAHVLGPVGTNGCEEWNRDRGEIVCNRGEKSKSLGELFSCFMIVAGLIIFTYASTNEYGKKAEGGEQEWVSAITGILGVVVALVCDALMYIEEEKTCFMMHGASHEEVQFFVFFFSSICGLASLVLSGNITDSVFFLKGNGLFIVLLILYSACNYGGTFFLLRIISDFNSSTATMITSVRKVITVLCSYLVYPKPFGISHFFGVVLVMAGVWQYETARKKMHAVSTQLEEESPTNARKKSLAPGN